MQKKSNITIGLIGNPNTGKSTLFNVLTGARQHVGNWPGKTVEKKEGKFNYRKNRIKLVDLPGSYSLAAYTEEEIVASEFILQEKPDVVVQILDAQNLERNLLLTIQLIELDVPLVLAINMLDLAKKSKVKIDFRELAKLLNAPVIPIEAKNKKGIPDLMEAIFKQAHSPRVSNMKLRYGNNIDESLEKIKNFIKKQDRGIPKNELGWIALKLLEGDARVEQSIIQKPYYLKLKILVEKSATHLKHVFGKDTHIFLNSTRYGFIKGLSREILKKQKADAQNNSDKIDSLLTNKFLGIPIFLSMLWLMFQATFIFSEPLMGKIEIFFVFLSNQITELFFSWGISEWLISLVTDGIIGGVGGVLVFVPIIGILFLCMAILEDSGYMARVAYVMDRLMHRIGLHGKAFLPLVLGFGCNVPGIMATRTLESKRDRLITMLINPFMSCGAKLPVYALFAGAFFSAHQGWVIFSLYTLGIIVAIVIGLISKKLFSKKLSAPFVIELPPYRLPVLQGVLIHAWKKIWIFLKKAGTIILSFSIIMWFLASLPASVEYGARESWAGEIGAAAAPVFKPLGFGNWQASMALISGLVAKEVVVGTFGTLYGVADVDSEAGGISLSQSLQNDFTPLAAYSFMVFVLLYIPCIATLAVIKRETNSWKWMIFAAFYTITTAWIVAFIVYQGGRLIGFT